MPNYTPPSRHFLNTSLLDIVYADILNRNSSLVDENSVLLLDGWKNSSKNEKYVVGLIHNVNGEKIFLNSGDFTEKSKTALALKDVVEKATVDIKEKYNTNVFAVVSDNVSSMLCMGKMIDSWHLTCNSHSGDLLAKAVVNHSFSTKVTQVLKTFKSSQLERKLTKLGGKRIVLPGDTRWCSYRDAFRYCLENLNFMRHIIIKEGLLEIKKEIVDLISDKDFEEELLVYIIIFDGICELVNKCQRSDFNIADAVEE